MSERPDPPVLQWALTAAESTAVIEAVSLQPVTRAAGTFRLRMIDRTGRTPRDFVLKVPVPGEVDASMIGTNARALQVAASHVLSAPELIAADLAGEAAGAPATLETWLPGNSKLPATLHPRLLEQAGAAIATAHLITLSPSPDLPYRPRPVAVDDFAADRREQRMPTTPLLQEADQLVRAHGVPGAESVLVHGDAHPGNMLWSETGTALIDWKTAGVGDPGVDLGDLRFQAVLRYGLEAAQPVLEGWERQAGRRATSVAYWDAVAALNTPTDFEGWHQVEVITRRREEFLRSALARL
ncbi:aminoglycoside phosphotransferase family protein [Microlunatus sp. GCM10028923]|uniref:aminoglycoside phosphotransferase family protein n=1 Tax=Microlunatus sp. GCM10028923 TaxID=3273400 RepID=UPI0036159818